jgi:hypothetical protein
MAKQKNKIDYVLMKINTAYIQNYVDIDYDSEYIESEDRTRIFNEKIASIDINDFISNLTESLSPIYKYAIDRLFHIYRFYDKENYELNISAGYYGAENVYAIFTKLDDVRSHVYTVKSFSDDIDIIKYLLNVEYGYILPILENTTNAQILTINTNEITSMNDTYYKKVKQQDQSIYKDYPLPRSICINHNNGYRILDGYNRYSAAIQNNLSKIDIVLLS